MFMRTIYKYTIGLEERWVVEIRKAKGTIPQILYVGLDPQKTPCLWIELEPGSEIELLEIFIYAAGQCIDENRKYIGSFIQGSYVWHIYK